MSRFHIPSVETEDENGGEKSVQDCLRTLEELIAEAKRILKGLRRLRCVASAASWRDLMLCSLCRHRCYYYYSGR